MAIIHSAILKHDVNVMPRFRTFFEDSIQISFGFLLSEIGSYNLKLRNLVELVKGFSCKISSPNWNSPGKIIFM